jgi:transcriptional regulator GlxA family with amidase domain
MAGYEIALQTARSLLLDLQPTPQRAFAAVQARRDHGDGPILAAQDRLEQQFAQAITLQTLAAQVAMSPRNLHRRFTTATGETPTAYLQRVRVEAAKRALATTRNGVGQIAYGVGYTDEGFFRRLFRRLTGVSPGAYRRSFERAPTPRPPRLGALRGKSKGRFIRGPARGRA